MSRIEENPAYEDDTHDRTEEDFDNGVAKIQPEAAANFPNFPATSPPPNFTGQRIIPPPPPPADINAQRAYGTIPFRPSHQQEPRRQFTSRDIPSRETFYGRTPAPGAFDRSAYGVPKPERRRSVHKTPLQPHHFEKLTKASQFHTWEKRVKSAIGSILGYGEQLLNFSVTPDTIIQEQILNFVI